MITHGKCGKSWAGERVAHCGNCHEHFSSDSAFEAHQKGWLPGSPCWSPAEKNLIPVQMPWGTLWRLPGSPPSRRIAS